MQQTCSRCGGVLQSGANVCPYCGTPVVNSFPQQNSPYAESIYHSDTQIASPLGPGYELYPQSSQIQADAYAAQYGSPLSPSAVMAPPPMTPAAYPPQQPPARGKRSPVAFIAGGLVIVVVLAALGISSYFLISKKNSTTGSTPTPVPALYQASLTSDPGGWVCGNQTCSFSSDGYHIQAPDNKVYDSLFTKQAFNNMVLEVNGIIAQGDSQNAGIGIEFGIAQGNQVAGYGFFIYADGTYALVKWDARGNATPLIGVSSSTAIRAGLEQANHLKLVITGSHFTLYANNQQITQFSDTGYPGGYIGLAASGQGTETIFSDLKVTLPAA